MAVINYDITVLIAEHADMESLLALMLSSKTNYLLVKGYERSITKAKMAQLLRDPLLMPPLGVVLSSSSTLRGSRTSREILGPFDFAVAQELEARERRISILLSGSSSASSSPCGLPSLLLDAIGHFAPFRDLPPDQTERLLDGLRNACRVSDRIADCAALVHFQEHSESGSSKKGTASRAVEHNRVHLARQQYIRSLCPIRLAFLTLLASLAGMQYYHNAQQQQALIQEDDDDPFRWERVTAFKEAFLRHGTVILWTLLRRPLRTDGAAGTVDLAARHSSSYAHLERGEAPTVAEYYATQVDAVLAELLEYERGHWQQQPGLRPIDAGNNDGDGDGDDGDDNDDDDDDYHGIARPVPDSLHMTMLQAFRDQSQEAREMEEVDRGRENVEDEKDDDGREEDTAEDNPLPAMVSHLDLGEELILKWIKRR
ncbi:hypothetical protein C7999DRAFT_39174 [Corynascus novoguineensis]|uniref:Uncharacterized protein n=1 Tax=Corynascus novoguineensis TaxID=1126955 RepID=A0AAN7CXC3_9PEZI|nr:hypothetical protein C7999DRAFT_39174 [Corynascus novoguineensis]